MRLDSNIITLIVSFTGLFGGALAAYLSYRASGKSAKASEVAATFSAQKAFMEAQAKEIEDLRRRRAEDRQDYEGRLGALTTENARLRGEISALVADLAALRAVVQNGVPSDRREAVNKHLEEARELAERHRVVSPDD